MSPNARFRLICLLVPALLILAAPVGAHPGQHDQLQQVNRHLELAPDDQDLYLQRGIIYSEGGQYAAALADFRRAQELGEPIVVAFQLGVLRYRMGDLERARRHLQSYLARYPDYAPAHDYLARIERDSGHREAALSHLQEYFRLQQQPTPGHYLAAANLLDESGRIEEALAIIDRGQARLGIIPQLQRRAIELERSQGSAQRALSRLQSLGLMLGENPGWRLDMAELLLEAGQREEAAAMVDAASAELARRRPTPARSALQQRAAALSARVGGASQQLGSDHADATP